MARRGLSHPYIRVSAIRSQRISLTQGHGESGHGRVGYTRVRLWRHHGRSTMAHYTAEILWLRHDQDFTGNRYHDAAVGVMARNPGGRLAMTQVTLRRAAHPGGTGWAAPRGPRGLFHRQLGEDRDALRAGVRSGDVARLSPASAPRWDRTAAPPAPVPGAAHPATPRRSQHQGHRPRPSRSPAPRISGSSGHSRPR